ncbi:SAF domain-containing protein [Paenarthrobacter aurescens]|uniref:SAF domain-containing protein n=1 Tax=Paenarthrobacter aurescens TaxID=43663 RepID=UPI0021BE22BD|nr:SAF domain-containing protein [Paenarthrobacter aurescens]MCT9870150.1 SAF domain-containing protein [Paenarthrobacter aurescens]
MGPSADVAAARLKKPSWKDPRLLVGVLLVLASIAGVIALIGTADRTTQVYTAREDIAVGQMVTGADLSVAKVRLDDIESSYVTVESGLTAGQVALQRVAKNQLIPRGSLGQADALNRKPVAISVEEVLPEQATPGARVDVWVAMPGAGSAFDEPQLLLPGAEIAQVTSGATALGASKTTVLLVLVTDEQMPQLLGAQANKANISVVWNPAGSSQ